MLLPSLSAPSCHNTGREKMLRDLSHLLEFCGVGGERGLRDESKVQIETKLFIWLRQLC